MSPALRRDERGATLIEFAIVLPILLLLITGLGELAYEEYVRSVLVGAMQKAGRDSGLEDNVSNAAAIDTQVENAVLAVAPQATFATPSRKNYDDFADVGQPERYTDTDGDGRCDHGETYIDSNNNNQWDTDSGASGQGSANDVVVYTMTATFPRLFPASIFGMTGSAVTGATTTLKNQPYSTQAAPVSRTCT